jgi:hypothetical protein
MWSFDVSSPIFAFFFTKMISPLVITGPWLLLNIIHDNGHGHKILLLLDFGCYHLVQACLWRIPPQLMLF